MSIHIGAAPGDFAETVLLPGDPMRAKWAAETFLDAPRLINDVRGMLGYTGTWNGHPVTIHGSGMGMPTLSIYVNEMIRDYGVKTIIRIGSCGGMAPYVALRDVVIAMAASSVSTPSKASLGPLNFAPSADWSLLKAATEAASEAKVGMIYSSDCFYEERTDIAETLIRHGCLAVEMETAELYTLAARHGVRALSVCTVSDHIVRGEELPSEDRERSFGEMVEIALKAAYT
ncbi:MAG: purine-nucleoside phosphorylase [Pseudomonadota bacterium]